MMRVTGSRRTHHTKTHTAEASKGRLFRTSSPRLGFRKSCQKREISVRPGGGAGRSAGFGPQSVPGGRENMAERAKALEQMAVVSCLYGPVFGTHSFLLQVLVLPIRRAG